MQIYIIEINSDKKVKSFVLSNMDYSRIVATLLKFWFIKYGLDVIQNFS